MRETIILLLATFSMAAGQAVAREVDAIPPEHFGIWAGPAAGGEVCTSPGHAFLVGPGLVIGFRDPANVFGENGRVVAAEASYRDGALEVRETRSGLARSVALPAFDTLERCRSLPGAAQVGFGEMIALFDAITRLHGVCAEGAGPECGAAIFAELDVTGDSRLSEAEILRAARGIGLFSTVIGAEPPAHWEGEDFWGMNEQTPAALAGGTVAASLFGPIVVGALIRSYDYDGDGFLSLDEILQDRGGADLRDALAMQPDAAGVIGDAMEGLRSAADMLPLLLGRQPPF